MVTDCEIFMKYIENKVREVSAATKNHRHRLHNNIPRKPL